MMFLHGFIDAMLSRLSFMKPVLALAFHECASNGSLVYGSSSVLCMLRTLLVDGSSSVFVSIPLSSD